MQKHLLHKAGLIIAAVFVTALMFRANHPFAHTGIKDIPDYKEVWHPSKRCSFGK